MKKEIEIFNAVIDGNYLIGSIKEHHKLKIEEGEYKTVRTSRIVDQVENKIETQNTIYNVKSWALPDKDLK